jgi:predicted HTH transcriptional regulator
MPNNQSVAASTLQDFDRARFVRYYEAKYSESAPDPDIDGSGYLRTLENLELVASNRVTVAGLLLFGKRLPVLLPEIKLMQSGSKEQKNRRTNDGISAASPERSQSNMIAE